MQHIVYWGPQSTGLGDPKPPNTGPGYNDQISETFTRSKDIM